MKKFALAAIGVAFSASSALAAVNTYQVTGPVLELTPAKIVVQKDKDKWEIARDANTKLPASVKVGSKVTIKYSMTAVDVADKGAAPAGAPAAAAPAPAPAQAAKPAAAPAAKPAANVAPKPKQ